MSFALGVVKKGRHKVPATNMERRP